MYHLTLAQRRYVGHVRFPKEVVVVYWLTKKRNIEPLKNGLLSNALNLERDMFVLLCDTSIFKRQTKLTNRNYKSSKIENQFINCNKMKTSFILSSRLVSRNYASPVNVLFIGIPVKKKEMRDLRGEKRIILPNTSIQRIFFFSEQNHTTMNFINFFKLYLYTILFFHW